MANKYLVTSPDFAGVTFTRTSANRTYTHVVVSNGRRPEYYIDRYIRSIPQALENIAYYEREIALCEAGTPTYRGTTVEQLRSGLAHERKLVEQYSDPAWREARAAERTAQVIEHGWAGRRDLAQKLAATCRSRGYLNVRILEATPAPAPTPKSRARGLEIRQSSIDGTRYLTTRGAPVARRLCPWLLARGHDEATCLECRAIREAAR